MFEGFVWVGYLFPGYRPGFQASLTPFPLLGEQCPSRPDRFLMFIRIYIRTSGENLHACFIFLLSFPFYLTDQKQKII
jgi:hypothetical protein